MKFGTCAFADCPEAAIYAHDAYGPPGLCEEHLPKDCAFAPFLGQQQKQIAATQKVLFMGGAGGGGKSLIGRMKYIRQLQHENGRMQAARKQRKKFHSRAWGIYFRRKTKDMLQVWERSKVEFPLIDPAADFNAETKTWVFPNCGGAKFQFSHMEHRDNRYDHKSSEFTYCVSQGTPVLMANGNYLPVEAVRPGDYVATLEGPKAVTHTWETGIKPCVRAVVRDASGTLVGEQTHPTSHPVLTTDGVRPPPLASRSQSSEPPHEEGRAWTSYESLLRAHQGLQETSASTAGVGTGSAASGGSLQGRLPPQQLSVRVALYEPRSQTERPEAAHAPFHVTASTLPAGSPDGYPSERGSRGGRPRSQTGADRTSSPRRGDAGERSRGDSTQDGQQASPTRTQSQRGTWVHPYKMEERAVFSGDLSFGTCELSPCGSLPTYDLTVADVNHYITASKLINRNCFFDELSEFEEEMYDYIETRLRTDDPELQPYLQMCSASNPDGKHMLWVKRRFIDVAPPETVVRWETELRDGRVKHYDQVFIPSRLDDNPKLMASGEYEMGLLQKPKHIREAILLGNWQYAAGAFLADYLNLEIHAVEDHDPPSGSRIFRSGDWGIRKPSSLGWWYEDADGGITLFYHLRTVGLNVDKVAAKIKQVEQMFGLWDEEADESKLNFSRSPLDAACFAKHGLSGSVTIAGEFKDHGIRWKPSKKDRYNGAAQIVRRLTTMIPAAFEGAERPWERERPMLRFMRRCKSPLETLPVLPPDPNDANDVDTTADDHDWDMCFEAGTLVVTDHGPARIEDLVGTNPVVLSSDGRFRQGYDVRRTRSNAEIIEVLLDDGSAIHCTPDHRFMLEDGTWEMARNLFGRKVKCWRSLPPSKSSSESGTGSAGTTSSGTATASTEPSGSTSTAPCPTATTSITSMRTGGTIRSEISPASSDQNTSPSTPASLAGAESSFETSPAVPTQRERGTEARPGEPGTGKTQSPPQRPENGGPSSAPNAAPSSLPSTPRPSSAVSDVQTVTGLVRAGRGDVFCLTVPETEAFCVEQGTVVHNCMYACLEVPIDHDPPEKDDLVLPDDEPKRRKGGGGWMQGPWSQ